jgi:hypothetical protein
MRLSFKSALQKFANHAYTFNETSQVTKWTCIETLSAIPLPNNKDLFKYHVLLLFTLTHPENKKVYQSALRELDRMAQHLQQNGNALLAMYNDSGLPFTKMTTRFTQDAFYNLIKQPSLSITLDSLENDAFTLNTFLNLTLPPLFKEETTANLSNEDLFELFGVKPENQVSFLLQEIDRLDSSALSKDYIWQSLQSFFIVKGKTKYYSKSYNKLHCKTLFYTNNLIKHFDHRKVLQQKLPKVSDLSKARRQEIVDVIRNSMPLSMREIDTITYMNPETLQLFSLERGIEVAIYGMVADRQLPMQSFVGYTLFKNGYPISYGGSWIFGECAMFGLNIFEEYRGGESSYIMTQILRVYIQTFGLKYYEIEPYQFGNEEAIQTGAFWFYYKYGFRPLRDDLKELARKESKKIAANKTYRTSSILLKKLAQSNLGILFQEKMPVHRNQILARILKNVTQKYKGNFTVAIEEAKHSFRQKLDAKINLDKQEEVFFEEMALWAQTFAIQDEISLLLMVKAIKAKSTNYVLYNNYITEILARTSKKRNY